MILQATMSLQYVRVETGLAHPGHRDHVLFGSSGSYPVYKISRSDLDCALDHVH